MWSDAVKSFYVKRRGGEVEGLTVLCLLLLQTVPRFSSLEGMFLKDHFNVDGESDCKDLIKKRLGSGTSDRKKKAA